jgi:hypothetical protein
MWIRVLSPFIINFADGTKNSSFSKATGDLELILVQENYSSINCSDADFGVLENFVINAFINRTIPTIPSDNL